MNKDYTFTFTVRAAKVLHGPDRSGFDVGREIAEQIANRVPDVALVDDKGHPTFYVLTSVDFARGSYGEPADLKEGTP
jgi:hypothetical protein